MNDLLPLTNRQAEVLAYLRSRMEAGEWPALREVAAHFGVHVNATRSVIDALVRKGYVFKAGCQRSRALRLRCLERSIPILKIG